MPSYANWDDKKNSELSHFNQTRRVLPSNMSRLPERNPHLALIESDEYLSSCHLFYESTTDLNLMEDFELKDVLELLIDEEMVGTLQEMDMMSELNSPIDSTSPENSLETQKSLNADFHDADTVDVPSGNNLDANVMLKGDELNRKLKEHGMAYIGWTRRKGERGQRGVRRSAKQMGPRCKCKSLQCRATEIDEKHRQEIFVQYWKKTKNEKKSYIAQLVQKIPVKRCTKPIGSRRKGSFIFTLNNTDGDVLKVCKTFFLSTLSICDWVVRKYVE